MKLARTLEAHIVAMTLAEARLNRPGPKPRIADLIDRMTGAA